MILKLFSIQPGSPRRLPGSPKTAAPNRVTLGVLSIRPGRVGLGRARLGSEFTADTTIEPPRGNYTTITKRLRSWRPTAFLGYKHENLTTAEILAFNLFRI